MLSFIRNLIGLNTFLASKIQSDRLFSEADAFVIAGEFKNAFSPMKKSSDLGNKHATVQVAMMLLKGQGTPCDWGAAAEYLALAIARKVPNVHLNLGMVYGIGGYGLKRNHEKAEYHLSQALAVDNDLAAAQMLVMLRKKQAPFSGKENPHPKIPWK